MQIPIPKIRIPMRVRIPMLAAASVLLGSPVVAGLKIDDMLAMQRISGPSASPDGTWLAFTVRDTDLSANRGRTDVWLASSDGKTVRRLTTHPENDSDPKFSHDGLWIYFLSSRGGTTQVWRVRTDGGEAEPVTRLPLEVGGFALLADEARLLVTLEVYPSATTLTDTQKRDEEKEQGKVKALAFDRLMFRHWDRWEDGKRSHIFVWDRRDPENAVDLMRAMDSDSPTLPFGGMEEIASSPDGRAVVFAAKDAGREAAWSTNVDLFWVATDAKSKPVRLTPSNPASDNSPVFSPDGRTIAYLAMTRPGYESDRQRIVLYDVIRKTHRVLTEAWDRSVAGLAWSTDGRTIYATADQLGNHALFAIDVSTAEVRTIVEKGWNADPVVLGDRVAFSRDTLRSPAEIYSVASDGTDLRPITKINADRVAKIAWGDTQQFSFIGAHGDTVYGYAVRPKDQGTTGKVPVAFLIHGGPQGTFADHFHYRWNPQVFAGAGYGVVFIDFHGSTGYGQRFTDAIRNDWGGAPYDDLMKGLDYALANFPWLDANRIAALGASYGGYMVNWIHGNSRRFKAFVCHDGNLDERSAYFQTEELWFPEWEHGGTPWGSSEGYAKHNPIDLVQNWSTPTLVIHGAKDFRVVDTGGMATFTALQRRGIPSRFLWFPDENHWVLKPQNSKRWHDEVISWIDRFAKGAGESRGSARP